jgi:hypothetical protein
LDHNPAHILLRLLRGMVGQVRMGLARAPGQGTALSLPVEIR